MSVIAVTEEIWRAINQEPPYDHCYVCKIGWMDDEPKPVLYNRQELWLCKTCFDLMNSRARKGIQNE